MNWFKTWRKSMVIDVPNIQIEYLDYREITPFQGNLKDLYTRNFNRLKKSFQEKGGFVPMFVWKYDKNYLLDGHQRHRVLTEEKATIRHTDGTEDYRYPCIIVEAESIQDAKEKLLLISSQFGTITQEGFDEFTFDLEDNWLEDSVNFDRIMSEAVEAEPDYDDLIAENKNKPPILKITFESPEDLQKAEIDIQELIDRKYPKASFSVSAGEI